MKLKGITEEDFLQYKSPSMFIIFPYCTFKCEKECGINCCQNSTLAKAQILEVDNKAIVNRYVNNLISTAVVFGGLEPFDTFEDMLELIKDFREQTTDPIIIYTGYYEDEIADKINSIKVFPNIIVKFGRFIPNSKSRYDEVLGITLASENQYAKKIS